MTNLVMSSPPSATALTTLSAVKSELGIDSLVTTDDEYLTGLIASVSATVKTYLRRGEIGRASYVETFRSQPRAGGYCGFGRGQLILSRWPVASITSISEDGVTAGVPRSGVRASCNLRRSSRSERSLRLQLAPKNRAAIAGFH